MTSIYSDKTPYRELADWHTFGGTYAPEERLEYKKHKPKVQALFLRSGAINVSNSRVAIVDNPKEQCVQMDVVFLSSGWTGSAAQ